MPLAGPGFRGPKGRPACGLHWGSKSSCSIKKNTEQLDVVGDNLSLQQSCLQPVLGHVTGISCTAATAALPAAKGVQTPVITSAFLNLNFESCDSMLKLKITGTNLQVNLNFPSKFKLSLVCRLNSSNCREQLPRLSMLSS